MSNWQWNTFNKDHAEQCVLETGGKVKIERVVKMPLVPINRIMTEHFPRGGPDFVSIDIESLDLAVLRTMDFSRFRPKVICTETLLGGSILMDPETTKFLGPRRATKSGGLPGPTPSSSSSPCPSRAGGGRKTVSALKGSKPSRGEALLVRVTLTLRRDVASRSERLV